nr:conserved hypothetical protein [Hymenolepis microstoma]
MARDIQTLLAGSRSRRVLDIPPSKMRKQTSDFNRSMHSSEPLHSFRISTKHTFCNQSLQALHQLRWKLRKYIHQTHLQDDLLPHPDQILHDHIKGIKHFHKSRGIPISKAINPAEKNSLEQENVFILLDEDHLLKCEHDNDAHTKLEVSQQDMTDSNSSNIPGSVI